METRKGQSPSLKPARLITNQDVDTALITWFRQHSENPDLRIDGLMLQKKANNFARAFGKDTEVTSSWIDQWKKRWGIGRTLKAGECGGFNEVTVEDWRNTALKNILEKYEPNDICNADETGLFWQMLPENSLGFISKKAHGSKQPKNRKTLFVGANMNGTDKLPLLVIGKSKKLRAFKNVRKFPVDYKANKKTWKGSDLFEQYLHKLDRKMKSDGRKIVLVLDNCPAHPHVKLENVEFAFLPPNTTSRTQPMDAGVIRNFKLHYRCILASRRLQAAENGHENFKWSLNDCLLGCQERMVIGNAYYNCQLLP